LLLDPVLHLATRAAEFVVKSLRIAFEVDDQVARVAALAGVFGFQDHAPLVVPSRRGGVQVGEEPLFFLARGVLRRGLRDPRGGQFG
jgi:hypothetical protein